MRVDPLERAILDLFKRLKTGNRPTSLGPEDLEVAVRPGYSRKFSELPAGRWAWMGPRDEQSEPRRPGETLEQLRRRLPGLARTSSGSSHMFGGDGVINQLTFGPRGLRFDRREVVSERKKREDERVRRGGVDDPWLVQQEATRWEAGEPFTAAGGREGGNTACYPVETATGPEWLTTFEAGRPHRVRIDTAGTPGDLTSLGPLGRLEGEDTGARAPWLRSPATTEFVRLHNPQIRGGEWPMIPGTSHPGVAPDGGNVYLPCLQFRLPPRARDEVRYQLHTPTKLRRGTHRANLHVVTWRPGDAARPFSRTRIVDAHTGRSYADVQWGVHQCLLTEHWFIVVDSGFSVELRQFDPKGADGKERRRTPFDPPGSSYRGAPPLWTTLWCIRREDLDARKDRASAWPIHLDHRPTIHAYCDYDDVGGKRIRIWLNSMRYQDASEWIRPGDRLTDGREVAEEVLGLPSGDLSPNGRPQEVYRLDVDPTRDEGLQILQDRVIAVPAGTIIAAEPPLGERKLRSLYWVSQGTWPQLATREQAQLWNDFGDFTPVGTGHARRPASVYRTRRYSDELAPEDTWLAEDPTWLFGGAMTPDPRDPEEAWIFAVGLRVLTKDEPGVGARNEVVEELYVFDSREIAAGPAFTIRAKSRGKPLYLGFGIHGHYRPEPT